MTRDRAALFGRHAELAVLEAMLTDEAETTRLAVIRGPRGIGKSALLRDVRRRWEHSGVDVITVSLSADLPKWDDFGVQAWVTAIRDHFERIGDLGLADAINAVSRQCTPETYESARRKSSLLSDLGRMLAKVRRHGRMAFLVDDVHVLRWPALTLELAARVGHLVVAAYLDDDGAIAHAAQLAAPADHVIDLGPLPDGCVDSLLAHTTNIPVDEALRRALRAALGPLYGNPGTLLSTVDYLRKCERLRIVGGHLCVRDAHVPIPLSPEHNQVEQVRSLGDLGRELVALVATSAQFGINELPMFVAARGWELTECGRAADRLVTAGVLDSDPSGRLRCRCPALASAVLAELGPANVRRLHALLAELLLGVDAYSRQDPTVLTDHVASAGRTLPTRPEIVDLLLAEADRIRGIDPEQAARRYHAALWHAESPDWAAQSSLLRLLTRNGDYAWLGEFVAEIVTHREPDFDDEQRSELAAAAVLAALHTGHPVPDSIRTALSDNSEPPRPLEFCARWFEGTGSVDVADVLPDFAQFLGMRPRWQPGEEQPSPAPRPRSMPDRLETRGLGETLLPVHRAELTTAESLIDLATVFGLALGPDCGAPSSGPLAAYQRVVRGFADGNWSDALSATRELELSGHPDADTPTRQIARLLATEMLSLRRETKRAAAWLQAVPEDALFSGLRGWAETGLLRYKDPLLALRTGWTAYERARSDVLLAGCERLLVRLTEIALETDRWDWAHQILTEIEDLHSRQRTHTAREALFLIRGLVGGDVVSAQAAVDLTRRRGHQPDLAVACLAVGRLAEDPRPWLHEAHRVAKRLGSPALRGFAKELMRGRGVTAPRVRAANTGTHPTAFSATELRIIELIQDGCTNRQIAGDVLISEKTVEAHLTRLFAKTGCRSRLDLAAASLEGRLASIGA